MDTTLERESEYENGGGEDRTREEGKEEEEDDNDNDNDDDNDDDNQDNNNEDLEPLDPDITKAIGGEDRTFVSDKELELELEKAGVGDLRVVLVDGKPFLRMPSEQHNDFTLKYTNDFNRWSQYRWGCCSSTYKIRLVDGRSSRDPDLSYWGYSRCEKNCERPAEPGLIPDVIIQFSWKNTKTYEENAINDMMNFGIERPKDLVASATRPNLGYLIKVRFSKKRKLETVVATTDAVTGITTETIKTKDTQDITGLDIYRLAHGTSIANGTAVHERYLPGGPEVWIVISAQDLGITDWFWAKVCGDYKIKASTIFHELDQQHQKLR
jgi:hypothetical protein